MGPSARKFITPAVAGVSVLVQGAGGSWSNFFNVTGASPNCGGTPRTCTLAFEAFAGTDTITVTTYDEATPGSNWTSTGTATVTIVAGAANAVQITTEGVVAQLAFAFANPYPATGTAASIPMTFAAVDVDGYVVTGTYAGALAFADSDTSGVTSTPANLTASTQTLAVSYSGATLASPATYTSQIAAGAPGIASLLFTGGNSPTITPGGSGPIPSPALLTFTSPGGGSQTVTISSAGLSTPPYAVSVAACPSGFSATSTGPATFTIAFVNAANQPAFCSLAVTDSETNVTQLPVVAVP
jgi:hypothetical protein